MLPQRDSGPLFLLFFLPLYLVARCFVGTSCLMLQQDQITKASVLFSLSNAADVGDGRSGDGKRFHLALLQTFIVWKAQVHAPAWTLQKTTISLNLY